MKKLLIITSFIIILCLSIFFGSNLFKFKDRLNQTQNIKEITDQSVTYVVKDFNGRIAVFSRNIMDHPFRVTDICTRNLPKRDKDMLKNGIEAENETELGALLEDLCS